jgi:hypothetical protein
MIYWVFIKLNKQQMKDSKKTSKSNNKPILKEEKEIKRAGRFFPYVPDSHPIFSIGYAIGGKYPAKANKPLDKKI